jgi:superfamily I DNA/RNA helicase
MALLRNMSYITHCKPVIAIDEATDFSAVDLLAMHSLRHPDFSSVTLSGDLMQRMTINGLNEWENFSNLVDSVLIKNLKISYRQSPTLLSLAQKIYQYSTNKNAEYTSYMEYNPIEPKPLMKISEDKNDKIKWISNRIREIDITYRQSVGNLPSVAVFVPKEEDIVDFVNDLEGQLEGDIPVLGCPNGMVLGDSSDVRVYAIDKIKGLEFEAVFFHNLDQLEILQNNLLLKYIYVGLSRAAFYLGVTLSRKFNNKLHFIEECFVQDGDWQLNLKDKSSAAEINGA